MGMNFHPPNLRRHFRQQNAHHEQIQHSRIVPPNRRRQHTLRQVGSSEGRMIGLNWTEINNLRPEEKVGGKSKASTWKYATRGEIIVLFTMLPSQLLRRKGFGITGN